MLFFLKKYGLLLAVCCTLLTVSGCKKKVGPKGPLGTVHGKVTYKGKAVPEGTVITFQSDSSNFPGTGYVGADGTYKTESGIPVGTYKVSVTPPAGDTGPDTTPKVEEGQAPPPATPDVPKFPFPQKYGSADTSGETVEIKKGENEFNLDMKDG